MDLALNNLQRLICHKTNKPTISLKKRHQQLPIINAPRNLFKKNNLQRNEQIHSILSKISPAIILLLFIFHSQYTTTSRTHFFVPLISLPVSASISGDWFVMDSPFCHRLPSLQSPSSTRHCSFFAPRRNFYEYDTNVSYENAFDKYITWASNSGYVYVCISAYSSKYFK